MRRNEQLVYDMQGLLLREKKCILLLDLTGTRRTILVLHGTRIVEVKFSCLFGSEQINIFIWKRRKIIDTVFRQRYFACDASQKCRKNNDHFYTNF